MTLAAWISYAPQAIALVALVIIFRWLLALQRRVYEHAERVAHIEGQLDIDRSKENEE